MFFEFQVKDLCLERAPRVIDSKRRSLLLPSTLEVSFETEVSYLMFYSIVIYFCSQLSYFVSNRSDERLCEDLGRDKPPIFCRRVCKQS